MNTETEFASFTRRVGAYLIDTAILLPVQVGVAWLTLFMSAMYTFLFYGNIPFEDVQGKVLITVAASWLATSWLYSVMFDCTRYAATPGKMLLKISVIDGNGDKLNFWGASRRHFLRLFSTITVIGLLTPLWNGKRKALHDILAGTIAVINTPQIYPKHAAVVKPMWGRGKEAR